MEKTQHPRQPLSSALRGAGRDLPTTQVTPDDLLAEGGAMPRSTPEHDPVWREIEQDNVAMNPSAESMNSRG